MNARRYSVSTVWNRRHIDSSPINRPQRPRDGRLSYRPATFRFVSAAFVRGRVRARRGDPGGCTGSGSCRRSKKVTRRADKTPLAAGTEVRAGSDGFVLGDVEKSAISPQQFVDRLSQLRHAGRLGAAVRWVELYPDVAAVVLREPTQTRRRRRCWRRLPKHTTGSAAAPAEASWTALCRDRATNPQRYASYDQKRHEFMALVQNGQAHEALRLGLTPPKGARARCSRSTRFT